MMHILFVSKGVDNFEILLRRGTVRPKEHYIVGSGSVHVLNSPTVSDKLFIPFFSVYQFSLIKM